ncbi:TetR/AcrR family transcriptional regulator [Priestia endophytica]|uniref:TetR family transcriptional regulator n=1 Tax=Priestia endophytica TaxID=135735 RepID=A0AAX1Q5J0_9BACI|nr:TetR/AcrR family transcriptional regulator [Priestia endophytica]RAS75126.1 TetR family transcriptional regulator [Priestia endophytica]RAS83109.1 TetR family transcriptional regulator [Priestia endophytica]RAS86312.1 TetR family transcriptional regulator [Priestia endophytica]
MPKVDRRITKSQEAIKKAVIELMSDKNFDDITIQDIADRANVNRGTIYLHYLDKFDLLDKIIEEHINELRVMCESAAEMDLDFVESNVGWFEYFESNYSFFSTVLASSKASSFRRRFQELLIEEMKNDIDTTKVINRELNEEVILQFIVTSFVGIAEWWITKGMPYPPRVIAVQLGILIDRNL